MIKTIALSVLGAGVLAIAVVLILAASKPDVFRVQRTASIKAPPDKVFALINDFSSWAAWSPWEKKDPNMKRSLSGPASGKGAAYAWDGNSNVGKGRMEIVDVSPPNKLILKLDFERPMDAHNTVEFTLEPKGDATAVTWSMHGTTPFIGKLFHVFLNVDRMVGDDFEAGLANLRSVAER
jgi:uncharacterized protein YndB with AHSA1/START domain